MRVPPQSAGRSAVVCGVRKQLWRVEEIAVKAQLRDETERGQVVGYGEGAGQGKRFGPCRA